MPRKSIYFPDELLPRVRDEATREGRSVSQWVSRACEAAMSDLEPLALTGIAASRAEEILARRGKPPHRDTGTLAPGQAHLSTCRCAVCKPPKGSS